MPLDVQPSWPAQLADAEAAVTGDDTRRELLRRARNLLHWANDCDRHLMADALAAEAAEALRQAGCPELARDCEGDGWPWSCDLPAVMAAIERGMGS